MAKERKVVFTKEFIDGLKKIGFTNKEINKLISKHKAEIVDSIRWVGSKL